MVTVKNIYHQGAYRNALLIGFGKGQKQQANTTGAVWSRSLGCRYLDFNAENNRMINEVFHDQKVVKNTEKPPIAPTPGPINGHDTAPIGTARILSPLDRLLDNLNAKFTLLKTPKSDKFMWIFTS
jgi:hypothetical protein